MICNEGLQAGFEVKAQEEGLESIISQGRFWDDGLKESFKEWSEGER